MLLMASSVPDQEPHLVAIALMRQALDLLDAADEDGAALHLQHAISIAEREEPSTNG